jgi:hypothetical protein
LLVVSKGFREGLSISVLAFGSVSDSVCVEAREKRAEKMREKRVREGEVFV